MRDPLPGWDAPAALVAVLATARERGFLGPGPVVQHVSHACGFELGTGPLDAEVPALDLGSGGGLPGLVLAARWPSSRWVLLDAAARRTTFLQEAVRGLGMEDRVEVVRGRAEEAARDQRWRGRFGIVTARGFGLPAVTAECAAGFLRVGGRLVVSEPPQDDAGRWPAPGLAPLGQEPGPRVRREAGYQVVLQAEPCPERFPRRVPTKRPLF